MESEWLYVIPGQHMYQDVLYHEATPPKLLDEIKEFTYDKEDTIVATYPKSGTTWGCEIAYLLANDGDFSKAKSAQLNRRVPYIELTILLDSLALIKTMKAPRTIKTHLDGSFFKRQIDEGQMKVIHIVRNVKDTLVSYYHFYRLCKGFFGFDKDWDFFFEMFCRGQLINGDWFEHLTSWNQFRNHDNVLFVTYEAMKEDISREVYRMAGFMGKDIPTATMDKIIESVSLEAMRANETTNFSKNPAMDLKISPFLRKGVVGDWKNYFTVTQNEYVNELIEKKMGLEEYVAMFGEGSL